MSGWEDMTGLPRVPEEPRWEPPPGGRSPEKDIRHITSAGLRLDIGWLVTLRAVAAALYLFSAAMPDRVQLPLLTTLVAFVAVLITHPALRLPTRLRTASFIEALGLGGAAPLATVLAYVLELAGREFSWPWILAGELALALFVVMIAAAIVVEQRQDIWSPLARALVLWPVLFVPIGVFSGTSVADSHAFALMLGGGYMTAALVTLVARLAPLRVAHFVVLAGTIAFVGLSFGSRGREVLVDLPFAAAITVVFTVVAILLFFDFTRDQLVRFLRAVWIRRIPR